MPRGGLNKSNFINVVAPLVGQNCSREIHEAASHAKGAVPALGAKSRHLFNIINACKTDLERREPAGLLWSASGKGHCRPQLGRRNHP